MTAETTTARAELVAALEAGLPKNDGEEPRYRVLGYARSLDAMPKPTVLAWANTLTRGPGLKAGLVAVEYRVWALVAGEDPATVDDDLDPVLDDVLDVIAGIQFIDWTTAERGIYDDHWHGWRVTATATAEYVPTPTAPEEP
jgi:hypothetical protein